MPAKTLLKPSKAKTMFDELPWFLIKAKPRLDELQEFYDAGVIPALYDALVLVRDSGSPTPEWVLEGAIRVVGDRLKFGFSLGKGKGASGNELKKYHKDMEHFRRWQTVKILRKEGIKPGDIYDEASTRLKGQNGEGSDESIRKSFFRVQRDLKNHKMRLRYYLAMREVQELTDTAMPTIKSKSAKPSASGAGK